MDYAWIVGWIAPLLMISAAAIASATRHRWRSSLWIGAFAGSGFCVIAWLALRAAVPEAGRAFEIASLQVALSTAGLFVFSVAALVARKWQLQKK